MTSPKRTLPISAKDTDEALRAMNDILSNQLILTSNPMPALSDNADNSAIIKAINQLINERNT